MEDRPPLGVGRAEPPDRLVDRVIEERQRALGRKVRLILPVRQLRDVR